MSKIYRTANGGTVDLGSLIMSQENTRSVGNMGVNAKGDRINSRNEVIETRNEIVQNQYDKVHQATAEEAPIPTSARHAEELAQQRVTQKKKTKTVKPVVTKEVKEEILPVASEEPTPQPVVAEPIIKQEEVVSIPKSAVPQGGLAAAIAKAKQIKEEERKTPRQLEQEKKGVTKI